MMCVSRKYTGHFILQGSKNYWAKTSVFVVAIHFSKYLH